MQRGRSPFFVLLPRVARTSLFSLRIGGYFVFARPQPRRPPFSLRAAASKGCRFWLRRPPRSGGRRHTQSRALDLRSFRALSRHFRGFVDPSLFLAVWPQWKERKCYPDQRDFRREVGISCGLM
ncbi:hypothetical protein NL676_010293 [Syzygium grande]|nr:hypothetical protein NL676_010293 [Syzygium grande]